MTVPLISSALRRSSSQLYTGIRHFSSSTAREASWGFIGLGAMGEFVLAAQRHELMSTLGYPMAKNLRAKIPESDTMTVFDVNTVSLDKFSRDVIPTGVVIAKSPRELVENAVSRYWSRSVTSMRCMMSPIVLSMI